jgi:hypothetical protein
VVTTPQESFEHLTITNLPHHEGNAQHLLHDLGMAVDQVVEHHGLMACTVQGTNGMAADVPSPSGDQNPHEPTPTWKTTAPR